MLIGIKPAPIHLKSVFIWGLYSSNNTTNSKYKRQAIIFSIIQFTMMLLDNDVLSFLSTSFEGGLKSFKKRNNKKVRRARTSALFQFTCSFKSSSASRVFDLGFTYTSAEAKIIVDFSLFMQIISPPHGH